jgi:fibronectin-binding autotransporter adhesin
MRKPFVRRGVAAALLAGSALTSVPAFAGVVTYTNGENNAAPIVLTDPTTQLDVQNNDRATQSGTISETGGSWPIEKIGTGTLNLAAANTYTGLTTVSAGTLVVTSTGSLAGSVANNARLFNDGVIGGSVTNAGTFVSNGDIGGSLIQTGGTSTIQGHVVPAPGGALTTIPAVIGGDADIQAGTVSLLHVSISGSVAVAAGATLENHGLDTLGSLSGAGTVRFFGETSSLTVNGDNSSTTFTGNFAVGGFSPLGYLIKAGTGTLTLTGNSSISMLVVNGGTLNLTSSVSHSGGATNNATLLNAGTIGRVVTNSGTFISTGAIGGLTNSGTASVSGQLNGELINNAGTVTLTGATTGITTVRQGAGAIWNLNGFDTTIADLRGGGSIQLGDATLATGGNNSTTFAGAISGSGALVKTGSGTLALTGDNTYTGATTISGGTLALGDGGAAGSIAGGAIVDNGVLAFNRSDAFTVANAISGTGSVQQAGAGTTTLLGINSYTGGSTVSGGVLRGYAQDDGASLQGDILDNGTVEFAQAGDGTYAGALSGSGILAKTGSGRLVLTGNSTAFTGATRVLGGELTVNGPLAGSVVTVSGGGTVSGTGPIGGLIAQSGGTVSPGNGVGTLTVDGDVALQAGSTYRAEVTPTAADRIEATGTAQIGGTLAVNNLGGAYAPFASYVLVDAAGGRSGTFDATTGLSSFGNLLRPQLAYTANQVLLVLGPNQLAPLAGSAPATPNQAGFVAAYDAAVAAGLNTQPFDALYSLSGAALRAATDQISGGIYPTLVRVAAEDERLVREAVLGRLRDTQDGPQAGFGFWVQGMGSWRHGDGDGNAAPFHGDAAGVAMGIDTGGDLAANGNWRAGIFGHYVKTELKVAALASEATIKRTGGGAYLGLSMGHLHGRVGAALSQLDSNVRRTIVFPGFSDTASSEPDGRAFQAFGELGYRMPLGAASFVEPFGTISMARVHFDSTTETGGAARLRVTAQKATLDTAQLGLRAGTAMALGGGQLRLGASAAARNAFGDTDIGSRLALDLAPDQPYTLRATQVDKWAFVGGADAAIDITPAITGSVGYELVSGATATEHSARARLAIRF